MTHTHTRLIVVCLVALAAHMSARAQTSAPTPAPDTEPGVAGSRATADETFELNITERRITEKNFSASTAVEIGGETERGVSLRVGVAVGAEEIDVLLRNVRGSVRFRASLEEVLKRLGVNRVASPAPP